MTHLRVTRMSATVDRATAGEVRRVDQLLADVARDRLGAACRAMSAPPGIWCLRRLDLRLAVDLARPDGELETRWTEGLVAALHAALRSGSGDLVHYRNRYDALDELVRATATGHTEHVWAWQQLALVEPTVPLVEQAPGALIVAALARAPERALAAILAAIRAIGLTRLHRALGAEGWHEVARLTCWAEGADQDLVATPAPPVPDLPVREAATDDVSRHATDLGMLLADSTLAAAIATEGWVVDEPTYRSWAILVVAQASPGRLRQRGAAALVDAVARAVAADHGALRLPGLGRGRPAPAHELGTSTGPARPEPSGTASTVTSPPGSAEQSGVRRGGVSRQPGTGPEAESRSGSESGFDAEQEPGQPPYAGPTVWGGLLFLIAAAREAGVPDEIVRVPRLTGRSTRWVTHQLALRLVPAAPDDPAVLAMSGLPPGTPEPSGRPPGRRERRVLDRCARRWCVATARRLEWDHLEPANAVVRLAARRAEIVAEPGWIEVHLRLDDVDVDARRAGLDLDPGWVSWLGVVVRYIYA